MTLKAINENKIDIMLLSGIDYFFPTHGFCINVFTTPSRLEGNQNEKTLSSI